MVSYIPLNLKEALDYRAESNAIPYCGGTDLMVENMEEDVSYIFLHKIPEICGLSEDEEYLYIGAATTFTETAESLLCPAVLREAVLQVAAPAIRNLGTIGGNIGNGSPKADTAPVFYTLGAKIKLMSSEEERIIPIQEFYLGNKKVDIRADELITQVLLPKPLPVRYYYRKVGAREALAISRVSFVGIYDIQDGMITRFCAAFGAIGKTVICNNEIGGAFVGKTIDEAKAIKESVLDEYRAVIKPIRGRVSEEYRKDVCMNLLEDFMDSILK